MISTPLRPLVRACLFLNLCLAGSLAEAQIDVSVSALPTVAVTPFAGAEGSAATAIVLADLRRTGMVAPIEGATGEFSVTGRATGNEINGQLGRGQAPLLTQSYHEASLRMSAHRFADAIIQAITGRPGFAASKLAFVAKSGAVQELYLSGIDGFGTVQLTHDRTISASPALSRDGTHLAYSSYKSGYLDTYVIDLGTSSRGRVAFFPGINSGASFSPDGSRLALTLSKDGNPEIYTLPANGGVPVRITETRGSETSPAWSPTGDQLVYCSDDRGSPQLYISSANGVSPGQRLVTGDAYCTKPDWSSDGRTIAFTTRIGGVFQIGVYDLASRAARVVTQAGGEDPAWTADSRHLVYANGGSILLLDTATGRSLALNPGVAACSEPTVSR